MLNPLSHTSQDWGKLLNRCQDPSTSSPILAPHILIDWISLGWSSGIRVFSFKFSRWFYCATKVRSTRLWSKSLLIIMVETIILCFHCVFLPDPQVRTLKYKWVPCVVQNICVLASSFKTQRGSPGWVAQLVRVLSQYARVAGSIPGQDTKKTQWMNECINKQNNKSMFLSLLSSLSF